VQRLKAKVEALRAATQAEAATGKPSGFMEILPGATHGSAASIARGRFALDMREHLKRHGLGD
jgi:hypothetical protein